MMSKINEKSTLNVKLTVKPILFTMYHIWDRAVTARDMP